MDEGVKKEGLLIKKTLSEIFPQKLDGKKCIVEMKDNGARNWKQMEWLRWYFEWKAQAILESEIGGDVGPTYGNMNFDYQNEYIWDFKFHVIKDGKKDWLILNDVEAIHDAIKEHGCVGYCVCQGVAKFDDDDQTFKHWHDKLKGGKSSYEKDRIKRGASSRKRKVSAKVKGYKIFVFSSIDQLESAQKSGWIGGFQKNFRNADGSPRRQKLKVDLKRIPKSFLIE